MFVKDSFVAQDHLSVESEIGFDQIFHMISGYDQDRPFRSSLILAAVLLRAKQF